MHLGGVDQRPDVVGVQARRGELLGQRVTVQQCRGGRVADVHLGADRGQRPVGFPPAVLVHGLADRDVDLRDILGRNRLPQLPSRVDGSVQAAHDRVGLDHDDAGLPPLTELLGQQ
jgi:hypothetical protein